MEGGARSPHALASEASAASSISSLSNFRSLDQLLGAAQQQQLRQARRLWQLKNQVEARAAMEASLAAKAAAEAERRAKREAELAAAAAAKAAAAGEAEARRQAVQEAARRRTNLEAKLASATPKLDAAVLEYERRVSSLKSAKRAQRTMQRKEAALEERRAAILAAEAAAERRLQHKQELKLLQEAVKREEDSLADEHRRQIQARAAEDEAAKTSYYAGKAGEREQRLAQRQQEAELLRALRAEEAKARLDFIRSRAAGVNKRDNERREALAQRLQAKLARADALAEQREVLTRHIKTQLEAQQIKFKQVVQRAQATGKLELPPELLASLEAIEQARSSQAAAAAAGSVAAGPRPPSSCKSLASQVGLSGPRLKGRIPAALSPRGPGVSQELQRQEALLQKVLEDEIILEMEREAQLAEVTEPEERRAMLRRFAAEREAAKARILELGSELVTGSPRSASPTAAR